MGELDCAGHVKVRARVNPPNAFVSSGIIRPECLGIGPFVKLPYLLLHLPLLNNPNYTALPRSATAIEHHCWPVFESIEIRLPIRLS